MSEVPKKRKTFLPQSLSGNLLLLFGGIVLAFVFKAEYFAGLLYGIMTTVNAIGAIMVIAGFLGTIGAIFRRISQKGKSKKEDY